MSIEPNQQPSTQSNENLLCALCYLFWFITGAIFYFTVAKDNKNIKYHAVHSILIGVVLMVIAIPVGIIGMIPLIGWIISLAWSVIVIAFDVFMIVSTYNGKTVKFPIISDKAQEIANK